MWMRTKLSLWQHSWLQFHANGQRNSDPKDEAIGDGEDEKKHEYFAKTPSKKHQGYTSPDRAFDDKPVNSVDTVEMYLETELVEAEEGSNNGD